MLKPPMSSPQMTRMFGLRACAWARPVIVMSIAKSAALASL
jgi:hypothetical protein